MENAVVVTVSRAKDPWSPDATASMASPAGGIAASAPAKDSVLTVPDARTTGRASRTINPTERQMETTKRAERRLRKAVEVQRMASNTDENRICSRYDEIVPHGGLVRAIENFSQKLSD